MKNPPPLVLVVLQCVALLLCPESTVLDWPTIQTQVLGDMFLVKKLKEYDKDHIPDEILEKMHAYTSRPDFDPVSVGYQSQSGKALCVWCKSIYTYATVTKDIEPKKRQVRQAEVEMEHANKRLQTKEQELQGLHRKLDILKEEADGAVAQKQKLEDEMALTETRKVRALMLAQCLTAEETRWQQQVEELDTTIDTRIGDCLLCAATVAYAGPFNSDFRARLQKELFRIFERRMFVYTPEWSIFLRMADHITVREWQLQGLPADTMSSQNAVITVNSIRVPFLIDPQNQANQWLRKYEENRNLLRTKMSNLRLLKIVEECVRAEIPLMIEDCPEEVPTCIEPILCPLRAIDGTDKYSLRLGDSVVEKDAAASIYICTSLPNPVLPPRIFIQTTVVNFNVTFDGLADQLLSVVVQFECPDIEESRWELLQEMAQDQREIRRLESVILTILSETKENILDQEDLVQTLQDAKSTSNNLLDKSDAQTRTDADLNEQRQFYQQVARRGSLCYIVASSLSQVSPMYVFSLSYVTALFKEALHQFRSDFDAQYNALMAKRVTLAGRPTVPAEEISAEYLADMGSATTAFIFTNVTRGLFEDHKLLYAFLLCLEICRTPADMGGYSEARTHEAVLTAVQYNVLVSGSAAMWEAPSENPDTAAETQLTRGGRHTANVAMRKSNAHPQGKTPDPNVIPQSHWEIIVALAALLPDTFGKLPHHIVSKLPAWRQAILGMDVKQQNKKKVPTVQDGVAEIDSMSPILDIESPVEALQHLMGAFPSPWNICELSLFNQLLFLRALQPQVFLYGVRHIITKYMGTSYTRPRTCQLSEVVEDSTERTPIVLVLSEGVDPTRTVLDLAATLYNDTHLHIVSLGQGQGQKATKLVRETTEIGHWALLQNCHLARSWMPMLDQLAVSINEDPEFHVHKDFRLFLTTQPISHFPTAILQTSVKVVFQAPSGISMNLQRCIGDIPDNVWDMWGEGHLVESYSEETAHIFDYAWRRLLFALCFFHTVVQERRSYGSVGFNTPYAFSDSDLTTSRGDLAEALVRVASNPNPNPMSGDTLSVRELVSLMPWRAMEYLIGHVHYGGRVTDEWDRRCVLSMLRACVHPEVLHPSTRVRPEICASSARRVECIPKARRGSRKPSTSNGEFDASTYAYSFTGDDVYFVPPFKTRVSGASLSQVEEVVATFPLDDSPTAFGLHPNARLSLQVRHSRELLFHLRSLQGTRISLGSEPGADAVIYARLEKLHAELPMPFCFEYAYAKKHLLPNLRVACGRRRSSRIGAASIGAASRRGSLASRVSSAAIRAKRRASIGSGSANTGNSKSLGCVAKGRISNSSRFSAGEIESRRQQPVGPIRPSSIGEGDSSIATLVQSAPVRGLGEDPLPRAASSLSKADLSPRSRPPSQTSAPSRTKGASGKASRAASAAGGSLYSVSATDVKSANSGGSGAQRISRGGRNAADPREDFETQEGAQGSTRPPARGGAAYRLRAYRLRQGGNLDPRRDTTQPVGSPAASRAGSYKSLRSRRNTPGVAGSRAGSRSKVRNISAIGPQSVRGAGASSVGSRKIAHRELKCAFSEAGSYPQKLSARQHPATGRQRNDARPTAGSAPNQASLSVVSARPCGRDGAESFTPSKKSGAARSLRQPHKPSRTGCSSGGPIHSRVNSSSSEEEDPGLLAKQTPIRIFLFQETERYKALISHVYSSVSLLIECVKGTVLMSDDDEEIQYCVMNQTVPALWRRLAFPSSKPLDSFVRDLRERSEYMALWLHSICDPPCHVLSNFFHPQGFLTSILQYHARNSVKCPVDEVEFAHEVISSKIKAADCTVPSERGAFIFGFILECARWNRTRNSLLDVRLNETSCVMPVLHFFVVKRGNTPKVESGGLYVCPVYHTSQRGANNSMNRTNFVAEVVFPCESSPDSWTLKGVALVLQADE